MLRIIVVVCFAGLTSLTGWSQNNGNTQEKSPASVNAAEKGSKNFYQLNFVLRELENERLINTRAYSIIMSNHKDRGAIRSGEKVPFSSTSGAKTEWQQIDVGVNIDCADLEELGDRIAIYILAEISSVMDSHGDNSPPSLPIIRNHRWHSTVVLPLKQPTILYSSDDPASKRKVQLQLTATMIQ
jgi:hypothetical protein